MSEPPSFGSPGEYAAAFGEFVRGEARMEPFRDYHEANVEASLAYLADLQRLLFDTGWSRLGWPPSVGGLGGDPVFRAAMFETLTNHGVPLPEGYLTLEILAPVLLVHASHLAEAFLPQLLRGDDFWCQAFSEPDAGSDLASLRTRMEPDGDGWRLTGQKVWSSFGAMARRSVLLARSGGPGHRGLTMVLVDLDQPGIDVRAVRTEDGENHLSEIFLDGAVVPGDRVIGELGGGWGIAMYMLQWERGAWGWQQQGRFHNRLERALRLAPEHLASPQSLGHAYLSLAALRARVRDSVHRLAREEPIGPETSIDKLLLVDAELAIWNVVRHNLSPLLELDDAPESTALRAEFFYSRAAPIYGGSQEIQRTLVAQRILGLPREP